LKVINQTQSTNSLTDIFSQKLVDEEIITISLVRRLKIKSNFFLKRKRKKTLLFLDNIVTSS